MAVCVKNVISALLLSVVTALALACTVNVPPAAVEVVDGVSDLAMSMQMTSADLGGLGDATDYFVLSDLTPANYRIDSWHLTLKQPFHVDGSLPTAVWMRAEDDGGLPIGGSIVDDRYGPLYAQVGGEAALLTNGEHWPSELNIFFRVFTVDMTAGHAVDIDTGEEVDPLGTLYYRAKPGLPLSSISQSSPGDVTFEVLLEPPPATVPVDPSP